MVGWIRSHLTYPHVVSTMALVLALGLGTAWALERNSVRSKHLANGQVKPADLNRKAKDSCPSGMKRYGRVVCIDRSPRGGTTGYYAAADRCTSAGLRLPTQGEAWLARKLITVNGHGFWTSMSYRQTNVGSAAADLGVLVEQFTPDEDYFRVHALAATVSVRCATPPGPG